MITITRKLAYAAAWDAGNRSMRAAGRTVWSCEDFAACVEEFYRLWPEGLEGEPNEPATLDSI